MVEMTAQHIPVLAAEVIDIVDPLHGETVIDATFGAGGHSSLLAERIGSDGLLIAIDRDTAAESRFDEFAAEAQCDTRFVHGSFAAVLDDLAEEGVRAGVILMDLGISSMQIDTRERGFAYSCDSPLDMRMDTTQEFSAADLVADWDERQIARTLRQFGEERHSGAIAREIVRTRDRSAITTTGELVGCVERAVPTPALFAGGHPAKRTFQAIRIAVNDELGQIDAALPAAWGALATGGRLAVISFHSLEDRRVKQFLAGKARGCICPPDLPVCGCGRVPVGELLTRRSVVPTSGETAHNPRSRSARLRVAHKIEGES
jgi:16S rRNA (cytosine1402-N4)-methyltransferase